MSLRKGLRQADPRFHGKQLCVTIADGNGRELVCYHPDCPIGPVLNTDREITEDISQRIIDALKATLQMWETKEHPRFAHGPAEIIEWKPK
jgi:hypothetical protein